MNIRTKPTIFALTIPVLGAIFSATAWAADPTPCFNESYNESQYGYNNPVCGNYKAEASPAEAYIDTVARRDRDGKGDRHDRHEKSSGHAVIIDVRSAPEYRAGHTEHAYNVPYPFIYATCGATGRWPDGACKSTISQVPQPGDDFVAYVESLIPNKDTPIYTLCRTGHRSVGAAHLLADAGYTNVRNIWEGFVGLYLNAPQVTGYNGDGTPVIGNAPVDLNHDGVLTDEDKNGWRYHQALPYDTRLLQNKIYQLGTEYYYMD